MIRTGCRVTVLTSVIVRFAAFATQSRVGLATSAAGASKPKRGPRSVAFQAPVAALMTVTVFDRSLATHTRPRLTASALGWANPYPRKSFACAPEPVSNTRTELAWPLATHRRPRKSMRELAEGTWGIVRITVPFTAFSSVMVLASVFATQSRPAPATIAPGAANPYCELLFTRGRSTGLRPIPVTESPAEFVIHIRPPAAAAPAGRRSLNSGPWYTSACGARSEVTSVQVTTMIAGLHAARGPRVTCQITIVTPAHTRAMTPTRTTAARGPRRGGTDPGPAGDAACRGEYPMFAASTALINP